MHGGHALALESTDMEGVKREKAELIALFPQELFFLYMQHTFVHIFKYSGFTTNVKILNILWQIYRRPTAYEVYFEESYVGLQRTTSARNCGLQLLDSWCRHIDFV